MTIQESVSNSNYNGMWLSAEKRFAKGLTFNTSFTFSKSIDNNSVGSSNPQIQNFYNIAAERALSDFDARQRFVFSGIYLLPFKWDANGFTRRLAQGWSIAPIVNLQTGNPFSPINPTAEPEQPGNIRPSQSGAGAAVDCAEPFACAVAEQGGVRAALPGHFRQRGAQHSDRAWIRGRRFRGVEEYGDEGACLAAVPCRGV